MIPNPYLEPRIESIGEARVRLASWVKAVLGFPFLRIELNPVEEQALALVMGALIRRWPKLAKWKAPTK